MADPTTDAKGPRLEPDAGDDPQTLFATNFETPFWLADARELVLVVIRDDDKRIAAFRIDGRKGFDAGWGRKLEAT